MFHFLSCITLILCGLPHLFASFLSGTVPLFFVWMSHKCLACSLPYLCVNVTQAHLHFLRGNVDDDRRLVASDVTAYVNKNQYRVVQLPFKVWISKGDDVKRIIVAKPVLSYTSHHLMSLNFRLFHWVCSISGVSTPLTSVNPVWGLNFQNRIGYYSNLFTKHQIARDVTLLKEF